MVFAINPPIEGNKTLANFQYLAEQQNGTSLVNSNVQAAQQGSQASTVSINVGAGAAAATAAAPPGQASVVQGSGTTDSGAVCGCSCLCGTNAFPPDAGIGAFGGALGESHFAPCLAGRSIANMSNAGTLPGISAPTAAAAVAGVMPPAGAYPSGAARRLKYY
jgi:hypothetical protein